MVKFSHGCWHPSPDTLIDWAVEVVKAEAKEDHLHFVTVSLPDGQLDAVHPPEQAR